MLLIDLIRTVFIAWFKNKNVYLRKLTFKRYEYNFAISSTECVEAFLFADSNSPSVWTHGENNRVPCKLWKRLGFGIICR